MEDYDKLDEVLERANRKITCNCHNCRFVLPLAIELLKEIRDHGELYTTLERIDKFLDIYDRSYL